MYSPSKFDASIFSRLQFLFINEPLLSIRNIYVNTTAPAGLSAGAEAVLFGFYL